MRAVVTLWLALASVVCAQTRTEDYGDLLDRVRARMRLAIARIPNHTCTESLVRETFIGRPPRLHSIDRVRFEVAVVNKSEMFSWPGADAFEETDPTDLVPSGSMTTGEYASIAHIVFAADATLFGDGELEDLAGRRAVRFDYQVTKPLYTIRCGDKREERDAHVPFHGSFWVDALNERLLALEMRVDEIPNTLCVSEARILIEYGMVRLEGEEFPLPAAAEFTSRYRNLVQEDRNRTRFSDCRRYTGQSTIRFGEDVPEEQTRQKRLTPATRLPVGLKLDVLLEKEIGTGTSAGDPISAVLAHPVRNGAVEIPKGARLTGRVLRFQSILANWPYFVVEFEFTSLEFAGKRLDFRGRLLSFQRSEGLHRDHSDMRSSRDLPPTVRFRMEAWATPLIPAGFRMTWESAGR